MLSVYVVCWIFLQTFQNYFCIQANSVDTDQTGLGPHCLQKWLLKSQADDKADDNCCDWQFKDQLLCQVKTTAEALMYTTQCMEKCGREGKGLLYLQQVG